MNNTFCANDEKAIGFMTLAAGALTAICLWLGLEATHYNFDAFADPSLLLSMPDVSLGAVKWFMITDTLGYYLLLLPILFYAHQQLKAITPWAHAITACGFLYIIIGAAGASILSVAWPSILERNVSATGEMKNILQSDFLLVTDIVYYGLWNNLEVVLGGVWWLALGLTVFNKGLTRWVTVCLGASSLVDGLGEWLGVSLIADIGLNLYIVLGLVWPFVIGLSVIRNAGKKSAVSSGRPVTVPS